MVGSVRLADNSGFKAPPGVPTWTPMLASGASVTDAATGGDHTVTLVSGATYVVMADATAGGNWLLGLATVATAANIAWFVPVSSTLCFHMPAGYTVLHYECLASGGTLYFSRLED